MSAINGFNIFFIQFLKKEFSLRGVCIFKRGTFILFASFSWGMFIKGAMLILDLIVYIDFFCFPIAYYLIFIHALIVTKYSLKNYK